MAPYHPSIPESGISQPVVVEDPFTNPILHNAPSDAEYTKGIFRHRETGDLYALAVRSPNVYGRTHFLKNSAYSWDGTEDEFRKYFDKA